jgi:tetratricopeptide (TPR) repeat protein
VHTLPYPEAVTARNEGVSLMQKDRYTEALAALDEAIRLRPRYADAHFYRALSLQKLGRSEEAIAAYDDALRINPGMADAAYNKGNVLQRLNAYDEAIAAYEHAIRIEPNIVAPRVNLAIRLSEAGKLDEALDMCEQAIRLIETRRSVEPNPKAVLPYAWGAKGEFLLLLGHPQEALAALDIALDLGLVDEDAPRNRIVALEQLGRHEEAALARRQAPGV